MILSTMNGVVESENLVYHTPLIDRDNVAHTIKVFTVDWIASAIEKIDI